MKLGPLAKTHRRGTKVEPTFVSFLFVKHLLCTGCFRFPTLNLLSLVAGPEAVRMQGAGNHGRPALLQKGLWACWSPSMLPAKRLLHWAVTDLGNPKEPSRR